MLLKSSPEKRITANPPPRELTEAEIKAERILSGWQSGRDRREITGMQDKILQSLSMNALIGQNANRRRGKKCGKAGQS